MYAHTENKTLRKGSYSRHKAVYNRQIIKITDYANSSVVKILENAPEHPMKGKSFSIEKNKAWKKLREQLATSYFTHKQNLDRQKVQGALWLMEMRDKKVITYKKLRKNNVQSIVPSFMEAVQYAILHPVSKSKYSKSNYSRRQNYRSKSIWDIVKNNFNKTNTTYATLTFDPKLMDVTDLEITNRAFHNFIIRMNKKYDNLKYLATYSRQKNGNYHYHILLNIIDISTKELQEIWKYGIVSSSRLYDSSDVKNVTDYLNKNMRENQESIMGKKGYLYSKGLSRPTVLKSWNAKDYDKCVERFNELFKYPNKHIEYEKTKTPGCIVTIEFSDGTRVEQYLSYEEIRQYEKGTFQQQEEVKTKIISVRVYHYEGNEHIKNYFTVANRKNKK